MESRESWLGRPNSARFIVVTAAAAFCTYFCMYAFRKPFAAAQYADLTMWGMDYKIVLVLSQIAGYTLSKFIGIKVVSEMPAHRRAMSIVGLIVLAELALVGFGLAGAPYKFLMLFLNGLPLGMIWGLVFAYLEGRQSTEVLAAVLCASFISATGVVKGVGIYTMDQWGVSQFWMPAVTGGLFFVPLLACVWVLSRVPAPSEADVADRTERRPMDGAARWQVLKTLTWGLAMLLVVHMMLTALRDYRDKFTTEILAAASDASALKVGFSELPAMFVVIAPLAGFVFIRSHARAVAAIHGVMLLGFAVAGLSTLAFRAGVLEGYTWFVLAGMGLYLSYVPFHCLLFERIVALMRRPGNAGYLIYLADASGYLSTVGVLLFKQFGRHDAEPINFFINATLVTSVAGSLLTGAALLYFVRQQQAVTAPKAQVSPTPTVEVT